MEEQNILQNAISDLFKQIDPKKMKDSKENERAKKTKTGLSMQATVKQALINSGDQVATPMQGPTA